MPFRVLNASVGTTAPVVHCRPEVTFFEVRGRHFALDANSLCLVQVTADLLEQLKRVEPDALDGQPGPDGLLFARRRPVCQACLSPVRTIVLNVTNRCNLACRYCFVREQYESAPAGLMELDTAKKAIEVLLAGSPGAPCKAHDSPGRQTQPGDYRINFFGGEPLLNFELIEAVVPWATKYAEAHGHPAQFTITTNATRITSDVAKFLTAHRFGMVVSLDGDPAVHNDQRPFADGRTGSYEATIAGLHELGWAGYDMKRVCLRGTFTGEGADLVARTRHLVDLADEGYAGWTSVEPACLTESGCVHLPDGHALAFSLEKLDALFRYEYGRLGEWYANRLVMGKRTPFHHFTEIVRRLLYGLPYTTECGAGMGYVSVDVDGTIYPCHRHHAAPIGHVEQGGLDPAAAAPWLDNRYYARDECPSCPIRNVCGGGCRVDSILVQGSIRTPWPAGCWFKRVFVEEAAWIMSEVGPSRLVELLPRK